MEERQIHLIGKLSLFFPPLLSGIERLIRRFILVLENIYAEKWVILVHSIGKSPS